MDNEYKLDSYVLEPKSDDIEIVKKIFSYLELNNLKIFTGTGEWEWLENNRRNDYLELLENKDEKKLSEIYCNMFRNGVTYGYLSPSYSDINDKIKWKTVLSNIYCNIDSCIEFTDLKSIHNILTDNKICAPYGVKYNNGYVLPDSPRHYYYAYKIKKICSNITNPSILEIGGGYGGVINFLFSNTNVNYTYVGIDLLPGLLATFFYLSKCGLKVNLINDAREIIKGEVNLMPFEIFEEKKDIKYNFDLIFNSRSLGEASIDTINFYFEFINKSNAKFFYHENSNYILFPNSERHLEIIGSEFPIDKNKYDLEIMQLTPFTGGSGRYREFLYKIKK